uniref:Uncharacterized protein n=1 Tax=Triticum urartu TaxID=4572 RepID=A0A8R7PKR3_TRIUA
MEWWRRRGPSQTSAEPLGGGAPAIIFPVSERCSISHMTCTSSYAHVCTSSWSFTSAPPRPSCCFLRRRRAATTTHARLTGTTTAFCHHSLDRSIDLRRPPSSRRRL